MISWEEYIKSNILEFRRLFEKWSRSEKKILEENKSLFIESFNEPCQFVMVEFREPYPKCFIVLHSAEQKDIEILVLENMTFEVFSSNTLRKIKLLESLPRKEYEDLVNCIKEYALRVIDTGVSSSRVFKNSLIMMFPKDIRATGGKYGLSILKEALMKSEIHAIIRQKQKNEIKKTVDDLRRVETISDVIELRKQVSTITRRLETQVEQLDKRTEEQITSLRQLIGASEKFYELKFLVTDINRLKRQHISKEVFEAKVNELNTRIDSLGEIKEAYDEVLTQQNQFMKQQSEVMRQQSSFIKWIKYATILLPIAVVSVPVIEIISVLVRHYLGIS